MEMDPAPLQAISISSPVFHGQGVNFVFVDGHVTFLASSIDYALYKALTTRAGGEPVGEDY
jgi:prepilin-type processing-associated H-X9-DG protein